MLNVGTDLRLRNGCWTVVEQLDADGGGFGDLYVVRNSDGIHAVAKLVHKAPGADRELFIGTSVAAAEYPNVMPVIDDGEHLDDWVLVMPRAEKSLAAHIDANGPLSIDEATIVLRDVATALAAIDGAIVHRDVKPANILFYQGSWCLTDFGISRYADATTALDTRKGFLSKPYAAPEQWRMERATSAADVYAFGCIGYELLTRMRPFPGPEFREQHLNDPAPPLEVGTTRFRVLIEECLYKPAEARPTPQAILKKMEKIAEEPTGRGIAALAEANRQVVKTRSVEHARLSAEQQMRERINQLHETACAAFAHIGNELEEAIRDVAPSAALNDPRVSMAMSPRPDLLSVSLNGVNFGLTRPWCSEAKRTRPFTVVSEAVIMLYLPKVRRSGWGGRSHSLWFCDAVEKGRFAWYETGFMTTPLMNHRASIEPFHRRADEAEPALGPAMGVEQVAWPFEELDRADLDEFVNRWLGWLGDAAQGTLSMPTKMPEKPVRESWRQR